MMIMKPMTIYLGFGEIVPGTAWAKITNEETKESQICGVLRFNALKERQETGSDIKPENIGAPLVDLFMTEDYVDRLINTLNGLKKAIAKGKEKNKIKTIEVEQNGIKAITSYVAVDD